jgi:hypothetical protein
VRRRSALETGILRDLREGVQQHAAVHRLGAVTVGEKPFGVAVGLPHLAQIVEHRLRQRHLPLRIALADHPHELVGLVDRPTSRVAASLMRKSQAYMMAKQVLWVGFLTRRSRPRTCSSVSGTGKRFCRGGRIFF